MKFIKFALALILLPGSTLAGNVPNPVNAPTAGIVAGHAYCAGANGQQSIDCGNSIGAATLGANTFTGTQTAPAFVGGTGAFSTLTSAGITQLGTGGNNVFLGTTQSAPTTNGWEFIPGPNGQRATIQYYGTGASINGNIRAQTTGGLFLGNATDGDSVSVVDCAGTCANVLSLHGGTSGQPGVINVANGQPLRLTSPLSVLPGNITFSGTTLSPAFNLNSSFNGTTTANSPSLFALTLVDAVDGSGLTNTLFGVNITHAYGPGTKGPRNGFSAQLTDNQGATSDQGVDNDYVGASFYSFRTHTQGGTGTTAATAKGRNFGGNSVASLGGTATNFYEQTAHEFDCDESGTASIFYRSCITVASLSSANIQGAGYDVGIVEYISNYGLSPFKYGIAFGSPINAWPIDAGGTIIGAYPGPSAFPNSAMWGVDWEAVTFPSTGNFYDGGAFRSPGWGVDGGGSMRIGSCYFTWSATGIVEDCKGAVGNISNGAGAISAGGSGFLTNTHTAAWDQYGGVYDLTIAGGTATSVTVETQPYFPSTSGKPTTLALTTSAGNPGAGVVLTASWNTSAGAMTLNPSGTISFGTYTNTPCINAGYITINDSVGTPRKVMVCS